MNDTGRRTLKLYDPLRTQLQVHNSHSRFNIVCFGRQSGKTTYGINKIMQRAWTGPRDGIYWYILQTHKAARVAFLRAMKAYRANPEIFTKRPMISTMEMQYYHGPTIRFISGKNYQDLRVETLDGAVIDEMRQQHPDLWPQVIRPMLANKKGWADILSTPQGYDHFYDLFEQAKEDDEWSTFHAPSYEAPWWSDQEIESAKRTMSEPEFAQEIMAEFRNIQQGLAYVSHGAWNYSDVSIPDKYLPIILACDFNLNPMAWLLINHNHVTGHAFDEIWLKDSNTQQAAMYFVQKYKSNGWHQTVWITGDATGQAKQRASASKSDYDILKEILRDNGIPFVSKISTVNPLIRDRVNLMNAVLLNAKGETHFTYNKEKCPNLNKDFQRVVWKTGEGLMLDPGKDKMLTHISDAAGYFVYNFMSPEKDKGKFASATILR